MRRLLLTALVLSFLPATATAKPLRCAPGQRRERVMLVRRHRVVRDHRVHWWIVRRHGKPVRFRALRCVSVERASSGSHPLPTRSSPQGPTSMESTGSILPQPSPRAEPSIVEVGNVAGCYGGDGSAVAGSMKEYGATVLRVIDSEEYPGTPQQCVAVAVAEGYRVHLVLQWDSRDTVAQAAAWVQQTLSPMASEVWAVSIGNEQELAQGAPGQSPETYAAVWQAAEPGVRLMAPQAVLVAGEVSPWGMTFLAQALAYGLPGAQALAAHVYRVANAFSIPAMLALGKAAGLPVWFDEGLAGPDAFCAGCDLSLDQMRGAQTAGAWIQ